MCELKIMQEDLDAAKQELKTYQDRVRWRVEKEINTSTFERNCINDLLIMMKLKERIERLEFYLSLK